jgi:replicative DNA helicase
LQLVECRGDSESRQQEISDISRALKGLAKELNIPVIALSQLSRAVENRTDKRPMLADLRESGAIEQDADVVMFIYRDEVYNPDSEDKGIANILVRKHRNGPIGEVDLQFHDRYAKFNDLDRRGMAP